MVLTVGLVCITVGITAPYFGRVIRAGTASPMAGHLFAWFWAGLAIHALVLYYAATVASHRLAEDKQTGALELILSSPTTERFISRGLWLAYARRLLFPVLIALLAHLFFVWQGATMCVLESLLRDISRGRLMFYQRDDKDSYVLRGAGQNGIIDQDAVPSDDWLWSFTAPTTNAAPAKAAKKK